MADEVTLFQSAEEAWFWFIASYDARHEGARIRANEGLYRRPCEPSDILKICERLRRHRRLDMHHFRVLRHYGQRMIAPDPTRAKEVLSARLWEEAMDILNDVFVAKGIVHPFPTAQVIDFQSRMEVAQPW